MKKRKRKFVLFCFVFLIVCISIFYIPKAIKRHQISQNLKKQLEVELGENIQASDFTINPIDNITLESDLSVINKIGEYKVKLRIENEYFWRVLCVKDTIPPEIELQEITIYNDEELPKIEDFIVTIYDLSEFNISSTPIENKLGENEIEISVQDSAGNQTTKRTKLTVLEDKDGPIFQGLTNITIDIGMKFDLSNNVVAIDKRFGEVEFQIDDSNVNYNKIGTYNVFYIATDPLGNQTKESRTITIKQKDVTYMIQNFPTFHQYPNYPNGCESIALYNLLRFYNINVTPEKIVDLLKKGDGPYRVDNRLYGGNPEIEFVGDPRNPHGYGVYQKPIIEVANQFKKGIIDYTGHSLDETLNLVKQQIPVQVWVSINMQDTKVCTSWTYIPTGEKNKLDL